MMTSVKLDSRYADVETFYNPIDENKGVLISNGAYVRRIISDKDNALINAVDFEGGPMISVGSVLPGTDKKIKSIKSCYYVELE